MSYWIRLSNEKLNEALIKSGKNYKLDQQGHDYLSLDLKKLKVFWNDKPVSKLSEIEIGSWIRVEALGKDVANLGKEGRYGELVKIFPQNEIDCKQSHTGSASNLQKAFHLFSNRPDQYYQIPSDIRNDPEKSDEYLAKIWKEMAKNISNNNDVNESVLIDITGDVAVEVPPDAVGVLPEMSDEESSGDDDDNKNDLYEEFLNGIELSDSEDDEEVESKDKKRRRIFESKKEIFQDIVRLQALVAEEKKREKALLEKKKEIEDARRLERIVSHNPKTQYICNICGKIIENKFNVTHELLHTFGDK